MRPRLLFERIQMVIYEFPKFQQILQAPLNNQVLYSHLIPVLFFFFFSSLIFLVSIAVSLSNKAFTKKNNLENKMACHALLLYFFCFASLLSNKA